MRQPRDAGRHAPLAKEDLSARAARELRTAILSGAYQPGERLPSERELAEQLGIDRHTLRSAMQELELLRLITRRQGAGAHVLPFAETGTLDLLEFLVRQPGTDQLDHEILSSISDVARMTFGGVMDLAIARATEADVAAMTAAYDALAEATQVGTSRDVIARERELVRSFARGAHSIACELLINTFQRAFHSVVDPSQALHDIWATNIASGGTLELYRRMLDSIEQRDGSAAGGVLGALIGAIEHFSAGSAAPLVGEGAQETG